MKSNAEREWLQEIEDSVHKCTPIIESIYHYKRYQVIKRTFDVDAQTFIERPFIFGVPKSEAEMIVRLQKPKTVFENNEVVFLVSYKIKEEQE